MSVIHPTAVIDPNTELGDDLRVGPYAVIEAGVSIGNQCTIGSHAVIKQYCRIGNNNTIHEHAVIGGTPQDLSFTGYRSFADIGDGNVIREGVTIHRGSKEDSTTVIGDDNYFMAYSHIAHDCMLGNAIIISNNAQIAGHVEVGDKAFISGLVGIHQFCRIGTLAMVGHNSKVSRDCLPFITSDGVPARARGLNLVGLKRAGIRDEEISLLKKAYRILLREGILLEDALQQLTALDSPRVHGLVQFIKSSKRGYTQE